MLRRLWKKMENLCEVEFNLRKKKLFMTGRQTFPKLELLGS
jgi:hypothetical protein